LKDQKCASIGLDIGCGNGKYLQVNKSLYIVASDRSSGLVEIARKEKNGEVAIADGLALPFRPNSFDFAISIAVIHHFSTPERRIQALRDILETLTSTGTALIYVWALEQKTSRRGWDEGMEQDVMVPWVLQKQGQKKGSVDQKAPDVKLRYYHLYCKGELEDNVDAAGGKVVQSGYERDNWWAIIKRT
jgi:tRNA (uracil-5-)-methyltransferase TRM9